MEIDDDDDDVLNWSNIGFEIGYFNLLSLAAKSRAAKRKAPGDSHVTGAKQRKG